MIIAIDAPPLRGKARSASGLPHRYRCATSTRMIYRAVAKALLDVGNDPERHANAHRCGACARSASFDEIALKRQAIAKQHHRFGRFPKCAPPC